MLILTRAEARPPLSIQGAKIPPSFFHALKQTNDVHVQATPNSTECHQLGLVQAFPPNLDPTTEDLTFEQQLLYQHKSPTFSSEVWHTKCKKKE